MCIRDRVNIGADTNTSDLKNNYGEIKVQLNNKTVNTGRLLLGSIIGDHSKTSINTMLNTGTIVGVFANIFGSNSVSYTHLRAHETVLDLVCRLLLEKKKNTNNYYPTAIYIIIHELRKVS